jgi:hypothetical protein
VTLDSNRRAPDFDAVFRRWAAGRLNTTPADAARAVVDRIASSVQAASPVRRVTPARVVVAVAATVLVAATITFVGSLPTVPTGSRRIDAPHAPVPARDADLVVWLDDATPVYVFLPGNGPAVR